MHIFENPGIPGFFLFSSHNTFNTVSCMSTDLRNRISNLRLVQSVKALAAYCAESDADFNDLFLLSADAGRHTAAYASWTAMHAAELRRNKLNSFQLDILLNALEKTAYSSVRRNLMRILQLVSIPEQEVWRIADIALACFENRKEDIAVRAFAISVLENCLHTAPEMGREVLFVLERELPFAGAAVRVRLLRYLDTCKRLGIA